MQILLDELHIAIASYISPNDYPTYRLISQRFATIGVELITHPVSDPQVQQRQILSQSWEDHPP
jgi:hypothetical protein